MSATITVTRSVLREALGKLVPIIPPPKSTSSVAITGVRVDASAHGLRLSGTNFDAALSLDVAADVVGEVVALLPFKRLLDVVANISSSAPVVLKVDPAKCKVTCGRASFELVALPIGDYPETPATDTERAASVPAGPFLSALLRAAPHADGDEDANAFRTTVQVARRGAVITATATQGHCIARLSAGAPASAPEKVEFLFRASDAAAIGRAFAGLAPDAPIALSGDASRCELRATGVVLSLRLVDTVYPPNIDVVLQCETSRELVCDRAALMAAAKLALVAAPEDKTNYIELAFGTTPEITVRGAMGTDANAASDVVEAEVVLASDKAPLCTACNGEYLVRVLGSLDCELVRLSFQAEGRVFLVRPAKLDVNDPTVLGLMPLRLR